MQTFRVAGQPEFTTDTKRKSDAMVEANQHFGGDLPAPGVWAYRAGGLFEWMEGNFFD